MKDSIGLFSIALKLISFYQENGDWVPPTRNWQRSRPLSLYLLSNLNNMVIKQIKIGTIYITIETLAKDLSLFHILKRARKTCSSSIYLWIYLSICLSISYIYIIRRESWLERIRMETSIIRTMTTSTEETGNMSCMKTLLYSVF